MTVTSMHSMTLPEAAATLAAIGYRPEWTFDELHAAVPIDMFSRVELALRIAAAALHDEARLLEQYQSLKGPTQ